MEANMIRFDDGKPMDGSGAWRIEIREEIRYVLGHGLIIPVDTYEEGIEEIRKRDANADIIKRYDIEDAKRKAEFFYKGRRFKIMNVGGSIRGHTLEGDSWEHRLEVGDIVTFERFVFCTESNWSYRSFSVIKEGSRLQGIFWPQELMFIDTSFFEKLEE